MGSHQLDNVEHVVLVLSGKGGVGKSSVTLQLALSLVDHGLRVGILDLDLTGPSIPHMSGTEGRQVHQSSLGWVPVYMDERKRLCLMSIGFLLRDRGDSVVWRGPKKTAMVRQLIKEVVWGQLDYLLIDTPPGTSDEHISIAEELRSQSPDGAVLVTTPQNVATADVRKELNFCRQVGFRVLGVVENMSGYVCPHCSECHNIFSKGGGEALAQQFAVAFLGCAPVDPNFAKLVDDHTSQTSLLQRYQTCSLFPIFRDIGTKLIQVSRSLKQNSVGSEGLSGRPAAF